MHLPSGSLTEEFPASGNGLALSCDEAAPEPFMLDSLRASSWKWATSINGPGSSKFKNTLPKRGDFFHLCDGRATVRTPGGRYAKTHKGKAVSAEALKVWKDPCLRSRWLARHNAINRLLNH